MDTENMTGTAPPSPNPLGSLQALIQILSGAEALAALHADPAIRSKLRIEDVAHTILEMHPQRVCPLCGQTRVYRSRPCPSCHGSQRRFLDPKQRLRRYQTILPVAHEQFCRLIGQTCKALPARSPPGIG